MAVENLRPTLEKESVVITALCPRTTVLDQVEPHTGTLWGLCDFTEQRGDWWPMSSSFGDGPYR